MRITDIHIYGFGKLENFELKDLSGFSILYGENEAGKSTIMAFIHGVLFGFPTKQQSQQRYELKTHAKYGGKLTLILDDGHSLTIERIKGKAAGDVTLFYEDGSIGGEEELKRVLKGQDKAAFQGIYSFNIHGLQEISKLKEEDINRYLLSSGMTGTDALFKLEEQWQKELDRLFKKSGKKPEINQKVLEIKQIELQLKKAKEKNEAFTLLLEKKNRAEEALSDFRKESDRKAEEVNRIEALENSWQDLCEYQNIKDRLSQLENLHSFPVNGLQRFEKWQSQHVHQKSALEVTRTRLAELNESLDESKPDDTLIDRTALFTNILEKRELYIRWQDQGADLERKLTGIKAKRDQLMRELNLEDFDSIKEVQLDIVMKDRVKSIEDSFYKLQLKKETVIEALQEEKKQLGFLEERCGEIEESLLEETSYQELQKNVRESKEADTLKIQYELVQEQLKENKDKLSKRSKKGSSILVSSAFSILTGLMVWFLSDSLLAASAVFLIVLTAITLFVNLQSNKDGSDYYRQLKDKAESLREKLDEQAGGEEEQNRKLLKEQTELRENWKQWVLKLENTEHGVLKLQEEEQDIFKQEQRLQESFRNLARDLQLSPDMPWKLLGEAYVRLKELAGLYEEEHEASEAYRNLQEKVSLFSKEIEEAVEDTIIQFTVIEDTLLRMKDALALNEKKSLSCNQMLKQRDETIKEFEFIQAQVTSIHRELKELLAAAGAETEEEFRHRAELKNERKSLEQQEKILFNRLGGKLIQEFNLQKEKSHELSKIKSSLKEEIADLKQKTHKENESLAEMVYEISVLEEGESYTRLLYKYHEQKAELNELSREWMKFSLARSALNKTMEEYKKEKLPKVIETAEKYFQLLTNGEYHKIRSNKEKYFTIERKDGVTFTPDELSQGTKEQLYIAIRFALVRILKDVHSMPVIIDDGFVNFDEKRTEAVLRLMKEFKGEIQVLFFTCHSHIVRKLESNEVINLNKERLAAAGEH
ncbi:AAA family ATPase [Rossellomorea vietnamensis]|uniref:ATP-binding protein n=1 Tax=Rossellomorea vietnamensis TaxID=218284 RepID=UPI003CEF89A5